jgi:sugar O-acyltransferase (sialic acid O-acetyltransferase NeuD family)
MSDKRRLVIVGDSAFAEIACEYFDQDSDYKVVAFSVEKAYLRRTELLGRPVVPFETLEREFDPSAHSVYVAVTYGQMNRLRARLWRQAKEKGFPSASYVSSRAFVWRNVEIGEHCFIFENNVVQPFVRIGSNVVLWSGNHIGHHSVIRDHCFISSHVVVSGFVDVGESCFLGVNSTIANNVRIGKDCWISPGVVILKNIEENTMFPAVKAVPGRLGPLEFFKVGEKEEGQTS